MIEIVTNNRNILKREKSNFVKKGKKIVSNRSSIQQLSWNKEQELKNELCKMKLTDFAFNKQIIYYDVLRF